MGLYLKKQRVSISEYSNCLTVADKAKLLDRLFAQKKRNEIRSARVKDRYASVRCKYCKTENLEVIVLKDEIWKRINPDIEGWICLRCMEEILGRPLYATDLKFLVEEIK